MIFREWLEAQGWTWRRALVRTRATKPQFGLSAEEMDSVLDPKLYIGRCPQQVEAFLAKIASLLENAENTTVEINV